MRSCNCPPGFDGARCQQTRHSFNGNGWAWYKPLEQCEDSHTSFEFTTDKPYGLLLYNGPLYQHSGEGKDDFILLELRGGYPKLRINHGSGEASIDITGKDKQGKLRLKPLNDNLWHRIDIIRHGKVRALNND